MATGEDIGDGPGSEEDTITLGGLFSSMKNLGKAIQENTIDSVLESRPGPKKNQPPNILPNVNDSQDRTLLKDKGHKQDIPDFKYVHDDSVKSGQSSTSVPPVAVRDAPGIFPSGNEEHIIAVGESSSSKTSLSEAIQGIGVQAAGQLSLGDIAATAVAGGPDLDRGEVAAIVVPASPAPAEPNVGPVVALPGVAPPEPNVGPIVAVPNVSPSGPHVSPMVTLRNVGPSEPNSATLGVAPAQSLVALFVAPLIVAPVQPNVGHIVALFVAPPIVAPVQPNVPPNVAQPGGVPAQQNVAPVVARPAPAQPNVALIVAPAQPNAAPIVAPPNLAGAFDINRGLERSRLRPLRTCKSESEGNLWPKL